MKRKKVPEMQHKCHKYPQIKIDTTPASIIHHPQVPASCLWGRHAGFTNTVNHYKWCAYLQILCSVMKLDLVKSRVHLCWLGPSLCEDEERRHDFEMECLTFYKIAMMKGEHKLFVTSVWSPAWTFRWDYTMSLRRNKQDVILTDTSVRHWLQLSSFKSGVSFQSQNASF